MPLNLDALKGLGAPIQATLNGATFDLRAPEDLDATTYLRLERLQRRIAAYEQAEQSAELDDEASLQANAALLEEAMNQAIRLLGDLPPDKMTFVQKMLLMKYYGDESRARGQALLEKKSDADVK